MERQVRKYSKEYKQEAVSLALSYGNVNQARSSWTDAA